MIRAVGPFFSGSIRPGSFRILTGTCGGRICGLAGIGVLGPRGKEDVGNADLIPSYLRNDQIRSHLAPIVRILINVQSHDQGDRGFALNSPLGFRPDRGKSARDVPEGEFEFPAARRNYVDGLSQIAFADLELKASDAGADTSVRTALVDA